MEQLLGMAIGIGLQMNYNTEIQRLTEMPGGGFVLTSKDGRVHSSMIDF